jgi:tetratricopeptide (TPR) repeat protein
MQKLEKTLEALGHWERVDAPSARFGLPFLAEHDLWFFQRLFAPELLALHEKARGPGALALRGRLRRLLGDLGGARADLAAALERDPRDARALCWRGELEGSLADLDAASALDPRLPWPFLYKGALLLERGELPAARAALSRLARLRPGSALGKILLGRCLERLGDKKGAASCYRRAGALDVTCAAGPLLLARVLGRGGEKALDADPTYALITLSWHKPGKSWEGHLARLRAFAFSEPERAGWYYRQDDIHYSPYHFQEYEDSRALLRERPRAAWASALVGRGVLRCPPDPERWKVGMKAVQDSVRRAPRVGWVYAWRALALIKAGRLEDARRDFDRCLALQPLYHRGYAWRGALLRRLGRLEESLADLDRAVSIDEQYAFARHERSLTRRAAGDFPGAALDLDRAFRLESRYNWIFLAGREPSEKELRAGIAELDAALARHPGVPSLWCWRGQLKSQLKRHSEAVADFEEAVHLEPHHALAWAFYGVALTEAGNAARGAACLKEALRLDASVPVFRGWLADAELRLGRAEKAFALVDSVLAEKPGTWWARHQRASFHLELGRPKLALADARAGLAAEGRHADLHFLEARALLELRDLRGARRALDKALLISPRLGRAYLLRAEILRREGREAAALEDYRRVFREFPFLLNDDEKRRVGALLA